MNTENFTAEQIRELELLQRSVQGYGPTEMVVEIELSRKRNADFRAECCRKLLIETIEKGDYLRRDPDLGKFEGELVIASHVYHESRSGEHETKTKNATFYTCVKGPIFADRSLEELTAYERAYLEVIAGAIVMEDCFGFVTVEYYANAEELDNVWKTV